MNKILRTEPIYRFLLLLSFFASFISSISYALLSLFIPEYKLPLELGIAKIFGEPLTILINICLDAAIYFVFISTIYYIYQQIGKKKFLIFLILILILWFPLTYLGFIIEFLFLKSFTINLWGSSCQYTGFPFFKEVCHNSALTAFYFLNFFFSLLLLVFIWEKIILKLWDLL